MRCDSCRTNECVTVACTTAEDIRRMRWRLLLRSMLRCVLLGEPPGEEAKGSASWGPLPEGESIFRRIALRSTGQKRLCPAKEPERALLA